MHSIWNSKFYPKKVIKIDRVELSTEISHVKKSYPEELSKFFYPNSTLLILPDVITVAQPYLSEG